MSQPSPYTPGEIAHDVPGRAAQLDEIADALAVASARQRLVGRIRIDVGPRGIGKTSYLREAQRRAEAAGFATVFVTAGHGGLITALAEALGRGPLRWEGDVLGDRLRELRLTVGPPGATATATFGGAADPGTVQGFEDLLRRAVAAARDDDRRGLVLLIDEIQASDKDGLRVLAYVWQHLQSAPDDLPLALFAVGLGHTEDVVTDAASFSERFAYRPMASLDDAATREALSAPATMLGVAWDTNALMDVVERSQGYPYFIQVYGDAVWRAADGPDDGGRLTMDDVARAQERVDLDLGALYRSRWAKASAAEQRFLRAMAEADTDDVRRGFIAEGMGVATEALGMPRRSLMDKGLVEVAGHGHLRFTVPGFREYIRDMLGQGEPADE